MYTPTLTMFGLGIRDILPIIAWELLQQPIREAAKVAVPLRFWYHPLNAYDPYRICFGAVSRRQFSHAGLASYLGLTFHPDCLAPDDGTLTPDELKTRCLLQAVYAREICEAVGIRAEDVGSFDDEEAETPQY